MGNISDSPSWNWDIFFGSNKGFHVTVLMEIANTNYELFLFDIGTNGRISDGGVINNISFCKALVR
jgi:hypothetical protein